MTEKINTKQNKTKNKNKNKNKNKKKKKKKQTNKRRRRERRGYEYVIFEGDSSSVISATEEDPMKFIAVVHPTHHGYSSARWAVHYKL